MAVPGNKEEKDGGATSWFSSLVSSALASSDGKESGNGSASESEAAEEEKEQAGHAAERRGHGVGSDDVMLDDDVELGSSQSAKKRKKEKKKKQKKKKAKDRHGRHSWSDDDDDNDETSGLEAVDEEDDCRTMMDYRATGNDTDSSVWDTPYPVFHASQFTVQFLIHFFLPMSVPYVYWKYGPSAIRVQGFDCTPGPITTTGFVHPALMWLSLILFIVYRDEMEKHGVSALEVVFPMALIMVQRAMIALKYSSLTPVEYETLLSTGNHQLLAQLQLLNAWFFPKPHIIRGELYDVSRREHIDLRAFCFVVRPPAHFDGKVLEADTREHWKAFVGDLGNTAEEPDGSLRVSCRAFALALVNQAFKNPRSSIELTAVLVFGVVMALLPGVLRLALDTCEITAFTCGGDVFFGATIPEVIVVLSAMLNTFMFGAIVAGFLIVAVVDMYRLRRCVMLCGEALEFGEREATPPAEYEHQVPRVDMSIAANVRAWTYTRICMLGLGLRYRMRLNTFVMSVGAMCALLLFALVLTLVANLDDPTALRTLPFVYMTYAVVLFSAIATCVLVILAASTNQLVPKHRRRVLRHKFVLQDIQSQLVTMNHVKQALDLVGPDAAPQTSVDTRGPASTTGRVGAAAVLRTRSQRIQQEKQAGLHSAAKRLLARMVSNRGENTSAISATATVTALSEQIELSYTLLDELLEDLDMDTEDPLRVFGLRAEYELVSSFSVLISVMLLICQQIWG